MTTKELVESIRGAGGVAWFIGALNTVLNMGMYLVILSKGGSISLEYHVLSLLSVGMAYGLFVLGRAVRKTPDHTQERRLYQMLVIYVGFIAMAVFMGVSPSVFLMVGTGYTAVTVYRLKKHGPIENLPAVLSEITRPKKMTDTEAKEYRKRVNRNTWKTVGLAFGIVFGLMAVFIAFAAFFPEAFEDNNPAQTPIHITDPNAA